MHEQSFHEKEGLIDHAGPQRLSESRPKFKPVLVKKLLADESDDESDDQALNSDNSDEEFDDFQPLPDEDIVNPAAKDLIAKIDTKNINHEEEQSASSSKHKICKDLTLQETASIQSQWTSKPTTILDKRKSTVKDQNEVNVQIKSYSPNPKRLSYNVTVNKLNEVKENHIQNFESVSDLKDKQESHKYSSCNVTRPHNINSEISDEKMPISNKVQLDQISGSKSTNSQTSCNNTTNVMDTPMKQPHGTTRPNPSMSHRNIFQTPQNKANNEYIKNPIQTPATIFSHWSQHHMSQTPMQNQVSTRESMHTPATSIIQSQNARHETPRYLTGEPKSSRRPLAETMCSSHGTQSHGSLLPRLQELPNESQPSPPIPREINNVPLQETIEKKTIFTPSHVTHESKENWNPKPHNVIKTENHSNNQSKASVAESKHSLNTHVDNKPKKEYHNPYNVQTARPVENYEKYQVREKQNVHPPSATSQSESIQTIQWNLRNNKIITVKDQQYLVLGIIGQGMSCEVVRAQDLSTSELRAIKCVNLSKMDKDSAQGCLQEICMLDRLKDPCIVHMYSFEIKQPWVHVVMEIGDTDLSRLLKSMLQEKNKIPLTMILYYWTEMLTAVKHIHKNGVIHSDLKPANFLLVRGRLKLIDFGIASNINSDMTSVLRNTQIGTLNYISPEALMEVNAGSEDSPNHNVKYKISYKSDVWSLGCILYSLVYGVTPFLHIRPQWAKISAITDPKNKINFPLVSGSEPVPLILIDVMRKCLQRDPKARPTVSDLLDIKYLESNIVPHVVPNIPSKILTKIKLSLSDEEWKQFIETLDKK